MVDFEAKTVSFTLLSALLHILSFQFPCLLFDFCLDEARPLNFSCTVTITLILLLWKRLKLADRGEFVNKNVQYYQADIA